MSTFSRQGSSNAHFQLRQIIPEVVSSHWLKSQESGSTGLKAHAWRLHLEHESILRHTSLTQNPNRPQGLPSIPASFQHIFPAFKRFLNPIKCLLTALSSYQQKCAAAAKLMQQGWNQPWNVLSHKTCVYIQVRKSWWSPGHAPAEPVEVLVPFWVWYFHHQPSGNVSLIKRSPWKLNLAKLLQLCSGFDLGDPNYCALQVDKVLNKQVSTDFVSFTNKSILITATTSVTESSQTAGAILLPS